MFGRSKAVVGLDIGSSAVKAVELERRAGPTRSSRSAAEPVPPDSIVDGAIIDGGGGRRRHPRSCSRRARIKTKEVAASLSGNAVIVKKITLPVMTDAELAESIYWEAEQYIPFDIQDVNLDYQILATPPAPRRARHDGRAAGRGQEGEDRRLHRRHHARPAACRSSSTSTRSRCRTPTRSTTTSTRARSWRSLNAGASAININIVCAATSRCSRATSRSAATPTPRRCRRS